MITLTNSGWKSGLREWILQRFSGVYIGFYFIFMFSYITLNGFDYNSLQALFSSFIFKIITILFVFSLVLHSSIGMGIILTDYVKNTFLRIFLDFLVNLTLLFYVFCIMQILWGLK